MLYISDELSHYGVKGMKWGVRHEAPNSGKRKNGSKIESIKKFAKDHPYITIGATVAASYLAIRGGMKISNLYKQGYFTEKYQLSDILKTLPSSTQMNMQIVNSPPGLSRDALEKISDGTVVLSSMSDSDCKAFNRAVKDGYYTNCAYCTTTSALRRKGYDVIANNSPGGGHTMSEVSKWWSGASVQSIRKLGVHDNIFSDSSNSEKCRYIEKVLKSQGPGSYGDMHVFGLLSGHSVEYCVTKTGVKINDYQVKHTYNSVEEFFDKCQMFEPIQSEFVRLDNCKPDINRMLKEHVIKPR